MNKDLLIELLKKDVSFKDKEIDRLEEENKKLKHKSETYRHTNRVIKGRIYRTIKYIKNDLPYLTMVDEVFENCDGEIYYTYKQYFGDEIIKMLEGKNEK